jgi:hypothetical protein
MEKCKEEGHDWQKLYFRKTLDKKWSSWIVVKNIYICIKCKEIRELNSIKSKQEVKNE